MELYFQKYALSLRKRGKKDEVLPILEDLENEYMKSKKHGDIERSIRLSFMELLLIQVHNIYNIYMLIKFQASSNSTIKPFDFLHDELITKLLIL